MIEGCLWELAEMEILFRKWRGGDIWGERERTLYVWQPKGWSDGTMGV